MLKKPVTSQRTFELRLLIMKKLPLD